MKARPKDAANPAAPAVASDRPRISVKLIAAAVLILAAGLYASWSHRPGAGARTFTTGVGRTDTVQVDDATVILGSSSRIQVARGEVDLAGDAFFTVQFRVSPSCVMVTSTSARLHAVVMPAVLSAAPVVARVAARVAPPGRGIPRSRPARRA